MEPAETMITDLPDNMLQKIMLHLSIDEDGPENFAKAIAATKIFYQFSKEEEILKAIRFPASRAYLLNNLFWETDGLLCRCVLVGNASAYQFLERHIRTLEPLEDCLKKAVFRMSMGPQPWTRQLNVFCELLISSMMEEGSDASILNLGTIMHITKMKELREVMEMCPTRRIPFGSD